MSRVFKVVGLVAAIGLSIACGIRPDVPSPGRYPTPSKVCGQYEGQCPLDPSATPHQ